MSIPLAIAIGWACAAALMLGLWIVQRRTRNAGIVDVAWSFATGLLAAWFAAAAHGDDARRGLVGALALLWSVRLGAYLWRRVLGDVEEDSRYRKLREQWGAATQRNLFWFFQIQAAWSVLFALPMLVAAMNPTEGLGPLDFAGLGVWLVAIGGETLADRQLAAFRRRARARGDEKAVCREGLWRYSRHPNYFFEWVHWWAYVLIGVTGPWGWLTLLGPLVMLVFLLRITGVPVTEARLLERRGDAYRDYQRATNAFFPGPPKTRATT